MTKENNQNKLKQIIDNLLLINLFIVIFFAIFFVFAIIMQFNGIFIFINFIQSCFGFTNKFKRNIIK